ncbi:Spo0B domain-containing protein [Macrococcus bovicus]|uniref:SpoOB alpha-helical domain-containing protein n=1 Tax=Macrococcus bovicus TaxID=69968 RepID=A0A4V3BFU9_9STAP|nr:Spo0B domain-containing protein [Macrococcus bovicus]TDM15659.1 hypothetical protein ERX55_01765 [Macrococcus bovicus]WJP97024.1 Spo0B domain-containing protein [Macrococcus bovicus]
MKELDLYLRAKHDLSNQLQLLSIYCELEDYSKVQSVVQDWSEQLQREQLFIQLSWPQFVNTVVHHKLTTDFRFDFQVETTGNGSQDAWLSAQFTAWIEQAEGQQIIITIQEEAERYHLTFSVDDAATDYYIEK